MKRVSVEYRNKENLGFWSSDLTDPIETLVSVLYPSIDANGDFDFMRKEYHLYVGQVFSIEEIKEQGILSEQEIEHLREQGVVSFVRNENGLNPLKSCDATFENSQQMINRVNAMLPKLEMLGYDVPDVQPVPVAQVNGTSRK